MTNEIVQKVPQVGYEQHPFSISDLSPEFVQILRTSLFRTVTERLSYQKFYAKWVPKQQTDGAWRTGSAVTLLLRY